MRIGIEAQRLFRPHKHGMDRAALELILHLQIIDKVNDYFIFVKPDRDRTVIKSTANFKVVEVAGGPYPFWEQFKLPRIAKLYNCDILHCTSNTAPFLKQIPLITTLHDIIYMEGSLFKLLTNKASLYQKLGNLYRRIIVRNVVRNSSCLITVSNFEKDNIATFFKLKNKAIRTVYNGVSGKFTNSIDICHTAEVRKAYKLPKEYMLHIANKDPRKNTKTVLKAFREYVKTTSQPLKLLLLGCTDASLQIMLKNIEATQLCKHIVVMGYIKDNDLAVLYQSSNIFLFPSLREGFGIPIIEAMACGVPVITSNTSSMPEVAGNAALLIDPKNASELCRGILKILTDDVYKNKLIERGLLQSKQFTWNRMAVQVLDQYKQLYRELNI